MKLKKRATYQSGIQAAHIMELRRKIGGGNPISQRELAALVEVTDQSVCNWEQGAAIGKHAAKALRVLLGKYGIVVKLDR